MKKFLKVIVTAMLFVTVSLTAFGCSAGAYRKMRKDLETNGTYNATYDQYMISLSSKVDYYCYGDSDSIWLFYYDYDGGTSIRFFISFDKKLSGEYSWSMYYGDYTLRGDVESSEFDKNTKYLYYDSSQSKVSTSVSINSSLRELAATTCKYCLLDLELYFIDNNVDVSIQDLGFTNLY